MRLVSSCGREDMSLACRQLCLVHACCFAAFDPPPVLGLSQRGFLPHGARQKLDYIPALEDHQQPIDRDWHSPSKDSDGMGWMTKPIMTSPLNMTMTHISYCRLYIAVVSSWYPLYPLYSLSWWTCPQSAWPNGTCLPCPVAAGAQSKNTDLIGEVLAACAGRTSNGWPVARTGMAFKSSERLKCG